MLDQVKHAQFRPGQWVDFFPPQWERPGGFSISSSPDDLPQIELAIRQSPHPVVEWVFQNEDCKVDQTVEESFEFYSLQIEVFLGVFTL